MARPRLVLAIAVDPARLARAMRLTVVRLAPGLYRVEGGARPHDVDVRDPAAPICRCGDRCKGPCKHILAVRIAEGDRAVVAAALALLAEEERAAGAAHA